MAVQPTEALYKALIRADTIKVFIQNEAGSARKHIHDEKTLRLKRTVEVSRQYPFPYGFVLDTTNEDGDNVDCFAITPRELETGQIVDCRPVGLMEQIEDGKQDHNVIAVLSDGDVEVGPEEEAILVEFVMHVFDHKPGKTMTVGRFLGPEQAMDYVRRRTDR